MRSYIIIFVIIAAVFYEVHRRRSRTKSQQKPVGVVRTTGSGVRQSTQFSTTGSTSPGSGVPATQPNMLSTWGVGGTYGPGLSGPSYGQTRRTRGAA